MEPHLTITDAQLINSLINAAPGLIVWIVAIVLSIVLSKRNGGRPERFMIIGSCLMLIGTILSIPKPVIADYLAQSSLNNVSTAAVISGINLFLGLISLVGVICLFNAIWKKFNERAIVINENQERR